MNCQHEGCENDGMACYLDGDEEPNGYYCSEHAHSAGFCYGCGSFCGGVESFDFGNGLCETCMCENCRSDE